jgi:hypothetical protein
MKAKRVKETHHIVKLENKGIRKNRLTAAQKMDPAVL